jgi:8-oxo-dGTP diphosphatase
MADPGQCFSGAKLMVFVGDQMLILRRDHSPGIPWPGYLDFPGGGREGFESPQACAARETLEEVGLHISADDIRFVHLHWRGSLCDWFFVTQLASGAARDIAFGGEGAGWCLMPPEQAASHPEMVPHFARILRTYLRGSAHEKTGNPQAPGK